MRKLPHELLELSEYSQWVVYQIVADGHKLPLNPRTGRKAKSNDASTWGAYDEALRYAFESGLDDDNGGIGFEFANGYAGIDLDNVVLLGGTLKPFADEVVRLMDSYTEYSPSGKGLHILFKLNVPLSEFGSRRRNDKLGIEMYDSGRFFTITGNVYGDAKPIMERTREAQKIYDEYFIMSRSENANKGILGSSKGNYETELLDRMFNSKHGAEIRSLFGGDTSSYGGDDSRADLALCSYLAFWTNNDLTRMDNLFRQSGLMRRKWDEKRGAQTYGELTLKRALGNDGYMEHVSRSRMMNLPVADTIMPSEMVNIRGYIYDTVIDDELSRFQRYKDRKTGYSNLDAKVSLYPGLYVLGAISSLGKTTFCGQLADQLAGVGEHVLYFSLEQTRLELVCKGLSRIMARNDMSNALTSMEIRRGAKSEALRIARELYASQGEYEYIIECGFETNVENIVGTVKNYVSRTGSHPVVIIDYLQIIAPLAAHQTTKDVVDYNVRTLKKLQTENDLVVIVISSLNRANCLTPIDFSSFKESGGIEYTADVIWGLQLNVMNDELFDKEAKLKAKRESVKEAKVANPRDIELVCLKNRYGLSSYSCDFKYYAKYDLFLPGMSSE